MERLAHGGNLAAAIAQYGGKVDDWLDLSTGINPHCWPFGEIRKSAWTRLPGAGEYDQLLKVARDYYGVNDALEIFCANGTQAIIQLLPHLFGEMCKVEIVHPTYGEHAHCWQVNGHEVSAVSYLEEIGQPDVAVVVNPNNPDGRMFEQLRLSALAKELANCNGVLIIDEAFGDVLPHLSMAGCGLENVIVLKSFGKFFGLAGVRLGFAIGEIKTIGEMNRRSGPWAVSGPALDIGTNALSDKQWIAGMRSWILKQSEIQSKLLIDCGLELAGDAGLFIQTRHQRSIEIHRYLAKQHILVRNFADRQAYLRFGLCADEDQLDRLAKGIEGAMNA